MKRLKIILLICLLAVTSCNGGVGESIPTATVTAEGLLTKVPVLPSMTPSKLPPVATVAPKVTLDSSRPLIIFNRSGGLAGVDEEWQIYADGHIIDNLGRKLQVSATTVDQLWLSIKDSGFLTFVETYLPKDPCCDRFTYVITVRDGDNEHTVTTIDQTPGAPPELFDIIQSLNTLLAGLGP